MFNFSSTKAVIFNLAFVFSSAIAAGEAGKVQSVCELETLQHYLNYRKQLKDGGQTFELFHLEFLHSELLKQGIESDQAVQNLSIYTLSIDQRHLKVKDIDGYYVECHDETTKIVISYTSRMGGTPKYSFIWMRDNKIVNISEEGQEHIKIHLLEPWDW